MPNQYNKNKRQIVKKQKRSNRRRQFKPKLSFFQKLVKSVYSVICALQSVPAPVKATADIVASQLGVAEIQKHPFRNVYTADAGSPYCICYYFIIRSNAYILKSGLGTISTALFKTTFVTNYRSIRPKVTTLTITPSAERGTRAGYYSVAVFPFTSSTSADLYQSLDKKTVCDEQWLSRAPIYKRSRAGAGMTVTYRTPKSNTLLHMGVPLQQSGATTIADGVMAVAINCTCDNRLDFNDFHGKEVAVDIKLTCIGDPLKYDGLSSYQVWPYPIRDILNGAKAYHNPTRTIWIDGRYLTYDQNTKTMVGEAPLDEQVLNMDV